MDETRDHQSPPLGAEKFLSDFPDGICEFRWKKSGAELIFINDALCKMIGYSETDLMGLIRQDPKSIFRDHDLALLVQNFDRNKKFNTFIISEMIHLKRKDGAYRPVLIHSRVVREDATTTLFYVIVSDALETECECRENRLNLYLSETIMDQAKAVTWEIDIHDMTLYQSKRSQRIFGGEMVIKNFPQSLLNEYFVHPESLSLVRDSLKKALDGEKSAECEGQLRLADGTYAWMRLIFQPVFNQENKPVKIFGSALNFSENKAIQAHFSNVALFKEAFMINVIYAYAVDLTDNRLIMTLWPTQQTYSNDSDDEASDFSNYVRNIAAHYVHPEYRSMFLKNLDRNGLIKSFEKGNRIINFEFISNENQLEYIWVQETITFIKDAATEHILAYIYIRNINDQKRRELAEKEYARRDAQTGLLRFDAVQDEIIRHLSSRSETEPPTDKIDALILFDIDNFSAINNRYGYTFGERALYAISVEIGSSFRREDLITRYGQDEFIVFMRNIPSEEYVLKQTGAICNKDHMGPLDNNSASQLTCSAGIAFAPSDGKDFFVLYEKASAARKFAKNNGGRQFCVYGTEENYNGEKC